MQTTQFSGSLADGKGPSIWDTFCHEKGWEQNGDEACNSYKLWEKDLECIQPLSLSWARLLPDGTTRHVNQKGVQYYSKVIGDSLACNVSPMVTLYHFDLPQLAFTLGSAWPVFVTGDYPEMRTSAIDAQSAKLGGAVLGTADFNYYTSRKVEAGGGCGEMLCIKRDILDPPWPICGVSWLAVVPHGLRKLLKYIKDPFNNPAVYITQNGFSQVGQLHNEDVQRSDFYKDTVLEVAKAIQEDGVNVCGYFAWSVLDNFEWADGFSVRFRLFHGDCVYRSGWEYAKIISNPMCRLTGAALQCTHAAVTADNGVGSPE
ncbi:LOW QUALITY PROTEIN: cytosolic beta-glucosidase [Spinachia spinachia]